MRPVFLRINITSAPTVRMLDVIVVPIKNRVITVASVVNVNDPIPVAIT